jgi:hypothetical protein
VPPTPAYVSARIIQETPVADGGFVPWTTFNSVPVNISPEAGNSLFRIILAGTYFITSQYQRIADGSTIQIWLAPGNGSPQFPLAESRENLSGENPSVQTVSTLAVLEAGDIIGIRNGTGVSINLIAGEGGGTSDARRTQVNIFRVY